MGNSIQLFKKHAPQLLDKIYKKLQQQVILIWIVH